MFNLHLPHRKNSEEEGVGYTTQRKVAPKASDSEELGNGVVDSFIGSLVGGLSGLCELILGGSNGAMMGTLLRQWSWCSLQWLHKGGVRPLNYWMAR